MPHCEKRSVAFFYFFFFFFFFKFNFFGKKKKVEMEDLRSSHQCIFFASFKNGVDAKIYTNAAEPFIGFVWGRESNF